MESLERVKETVTGQSTGEGRGVNATNRRMKWTRILNTKTQLLDTGILALTLWDPKDEKLGGQGFR